MSVIIRSFSATLRNRTSIGAWNRIDILMFALTFTFSCIAAVLYVTNEHVFYWWDYAGYQDLTNVIAHNFAIDAFTTLRDVFNSTQHDYNSWFTLPLIPFVLVGKFSRLSYILGITVAYMYPFALTLGSVATTLLPGPKQQVFWLAVVITIWMPMSWVATFRGYPDMGGALFLGLALLFYLRDSYVESTKSIIMISLFLALTMIFRRHFTYGVLGFLFTIFLYNNLRIIAIQYAQARDLIRTLFIHNLRLVTIPILVLMNLFILARPFFYKLLLKDYISLYTSYMVSPPDIAYFLLSQSGILVWAIASTAILAAWVRKGNKNNVAFVGLLAFVLFAQWVGIVRQTGFHYTLQFLFFLVIGICSCASMPAYTRRDSLLISVLLIGIFLNLISGITNFSPLGNRVSALMATNHPPLQHPDYAEIQDIVDFLRQNAERDEPIFVAGSSSLLNYDILHHADAADSRSDRSHLNFLASPQVDSRDYYPFEQLLEAQLVVVAVPFQHHLAPQEQDVVRVVVEAFLSDWPITKDFERLDATFQLSNNVKVMIFRRVGPTSFSQAVQTLHRIQQYMSAEVPSRQPDWIALDGKPTTLSYKTAADTTYSSIQMNADERASTLLFSRTLSEHIILDGMIGTETSCSQVSISLLEADENGRVISEELLPLSNNEFHQAVDTTRARFAALVVNDETLVANESCTVIIDLHTISSQSN